MASATRPRRSICAAVLPLRSTRSPPLLQGGSRQSTRSPRPQTAAVDPAIFPPATCTEIYCAGEQPALVTGLAGPQRRGQPFCCLALLRAGRRPCGPTPCLPRGQRARLHGAGRAADLGQMKDAVRAAESAGALGSTLNQLFQRSFAVAKGCAPHRDRRPQHQHGCRRGAPGQPVVLKTCGKTRAVRRRGRDDRAGGHTLCRARAEVHRHCQPHAGARRETRHPLWRRSRAWPTCPIDCMSSTSW